VYVAALMTRARMLGTFRIDLLDTRLEQAASPVTYDAETVEARIARRERRWTPTDLVACRAVRSDTPAAMKLLTAYFAEVDRLFAELHGGYDPARGISAEPHELAPPSGAFVILSEGGVDLACGGVKTHAPGVGEIKRMYTAPDARGRGLGRDLLGELEDAARALGMRRLVLDTAAPLVAAHELYRSAGYAEVPRFNDNPYAARWFEKTI
jgi:GNAT superfamily N-acetyltransferase